MENKGLEYTAISTAFFSFIYIVISVIYKLNISGEIQCFGLVFSVKRADLIDNNVNNPSNNHISVGNSQNNNDITQEVQIELETV